MDLAGSADPIQLIAGVDRLHAGISAGLRELFSYIVECDRRELWRPDGCRDMAQWLAGRLGISRWNAARWTKAAWALEELPHIASVLATGALCVDKVVELTRFATPASEARLVKWAQKVIPATIRRRAEVAHAPSLEDARAVDEDRYLRWWWFDEDRRLGLEASFPPDQGALVAGALDRLAGSLAGDPDEPEPQLSIEARRADALVALASREVEGDQDADRATVVVHAGIEALAGDRRGCELEGAPVIHPEVARRLACDCRLHVVAEDGERNALGIGRMSRNVPPWLLRQLKYRDRGCTFPGCGSGRFLHAHHVIHWSRGGATDVDNLVLLCGFHHRLVHEHRWSVVLDRSGITEWFRPSGRRYEPSASAARTVVDRAPPREPMLV